MLVNALSHSFSVDAGTSHVESGAGVDQVSGDLVTESLTSLVEGTGQSFQVVLLVERGFLPLVLRLGDEVSRQAPDQVVLSKTDFLVVLQKEVLGFVVRRDFEGAIIHRSHAVRELLFEVAPV